ncbi:hypothetical protein L6164_024060 [Bauhinia variegata]|uniref:Uncharacterized protein n=1 Tax=Bauhinia variegata TaxID=167791 RepID=A0ACB9LWC3_BAUVA|nr:hypothetical protein L6164_024060 [Bauhinia variegata]
MVDMTKSFYQDGVVFSNLTHLKISHLQKLESLFLGQPHHDIFQKLEELHISECNQLKHLIANEPREIVSDVKLEKISIYYCSRLKHLIANDAEKINSDSTQSRSSNSIFPKVKVISIFYCSQLEYLMPVSFAEGLVELEKLEIEGCSQLKYAFGQSNYKLEDESTNQNLNKPNSMKLHALKVLRLASLQKIVSICSESYYLVCPSMDSLKLQNCAQLNIMLNELESRQPYHIITKLSFVGLDCLETLFVGTLHTVGFGKLEEISISYCSQLKHLIANDAEKINSDGTQRRSHNSIFPKVKVINIFYCNQLEYLMLVSFAEGMLQLEKLEIEDCALLKYAFGQSNYEVEDPSSNYNLNKPNLMKLQDYLETLFVNTLHTIGFGKLEEISISYCSQLKHLRANDAEKINSDGTQQRSYNSIFPKVKGISIFHCSQLEYLMPVSFAEGLLQLEKLEIEDCALLKYAFGQSNYEVEDPSSNYNLNKPNLMKLQGLKVLRLVFLQKIVSICSESYYPVCPSMDSLELHNCPQLNIMLNLLKSRQIDHTITKCLINMTSYLCHNGIFCNLTKLYFHELDCLETLFVGTLHLGGLEKLEEISIWRCNHLKHLIANDVEKIILYGENSLSYNSILPKLKVIAIRDCQELEYLMPISFAKGLLQLKNVEITRASQLNEDQSNPDSEQVCLPELSTLIVEQCNKLKCLFSFTTSIEFPKLKFLVIKEAYELKEVITCDEKCDKREQLQVKFPDLEYVVLVQLPKLREVYREVELQTVRHRVVYHCPKLSLRSSDTLENLNEIYQDYYRKKIYEDFWEASYHERTVIEGILRILWLLMMKKKSNSGSIKEKDQERDQENPKCKETVVAPLSVHLEQSNKGRVEESPTFDDVTYAKLTSSPQTAGQPQIVIIFGYNYVLFLLLFTGNINDFLLELSTKMPEDQFGTVQLEEKSCNWGKFLTLSLSSGPQMVEESPLEKTASHQIVPEKLDLQVEELVQNAPMNEPLLMAEDQALERKKVSTSSQLSFSTGVPLPISIPSPTSPYFSNKSNAEGDHILGGFDLNKPPKEFFEATKQSSTSPQSNRGRVEEVPTMDVNLVTSAKAKTTGSLLDLPQIIEETENRSVQKICASAKSDVNTTSSDIVQNAPTNKPLSVAEEQALKQNKVVELPNKIDATTEPLNVCVSNESPSNILQELTTFSAETPPPISTPSPTFDIEEFTTRPSPSSITIPPRSSTSLELLDEQPMSGPKLMDQKEELEETQIHFQTSNGTNRIKKTVEASDQEGPKSSKGSDEEVPISSKATNPVRSLLKTNAICIHQGQISGSPTKTYVVEDVEELKDDDLVRLLQSMEEDSDTSETAATNLTLEDNLVAEALTDLQFYLGVPLKGIASDEAASLRLEKALNFLSCHYFEDDIVSYELRASIDSLHQEFPSILSSFKQASATVDRFTLLEDKEKSMKEELPQRMESAVTLIGNISKTDMSMAEIQQEEASLIEQISRLQDELNNTERRKRECEAGLSSLQEQKNKCIAETKEFKTEFESVKEGKSRMIEDHRKAQQKLFKVNNKWSALCSQFEQNHSATRSLS